MASRLQSQNTCKVDLSAGITVASMLIPQGMALCHARRTRTHPWLYCRDGNLDLYAIFGAPDSWQLVPVAIGIPWLQPQNHQPGRPTSASEYLLYALTLGFL